MHSLAMIASCADGPPAMRPCRRTWHRGWRRSPTRTAVTPRRMRGADAQPSRRGASLCRRPAMAASMRSGWIAPEEQIPHRPPAEDNESAPADMFGLVVQDVAPLAPGGEVGGSVVRRVVVPVGGGEVDPRGADRADASAMATVTRRPLPSRQWPRRASNHRPSPRWNTRAPFGRPHCSQAPAARPNRITRESSGQSIG